MKAVLSVILVSVALLFAACDSRQMGDSEVTAKVKSKLVADPQTSAIKIGVETKSNVVTLTGTVPTDTEKKKAEELARETSGVKGVVNNINVKPDSLGATNIDEKARDAAKDVARTAEDVGIMAEVKTKLLANSITGASIYVDNGQVVLKGQVDSPQKKAKAEELARDSAGVKGVTNQLTARNYASS